MEKKIRKIFDKVLKKSITLSSKAVANFINGGFGTDYPLDSQITYNWTENYDDELNRTIADGIMTINGEVSYHVEAQIGEDEEMQFRVFDYGYRHALNRRNGSDVLYFPEPLVIYLYKHGKIPDEQTIVLDFGTQGQFLYKVKNFKLLSYTLEELNEKKMLILLPFMILKFRDELSKAKYRTKDNLMALKNFILDDILGIVDENVNLGNLTLADAGRIRNLLAELYRYLYADYEECQKEGINDMVEEGLVLEMDIIEHRHKMEMQQREKEVAEEVTREVTKEVTKEVTESMTASMVRNVYEEVQDIKRVSKLLKVPESKIQEILESDAAD
ncbi:MAG: hypothetical protein PHC41_10375 [Lachnospiraceae bacterium]|nr:hypothetical protein [Lachnospiraceae bacterium]MDD3616614.1 hypothetical protein [Lachnospiraceae bacterium]